MPVPGDVVRVQILQDDRVVVEGIEPRESSLQRRSSSGRAKTLAANVDLLVAVTALADPPPRLITLDQLLAFAELTSIEAVVVFTKPDVADPVCSGVLAKVYVGLGYQTLIINPKLGENVEGLRALLHGHRALLAGVSGVGKSTIFRALGGTAVVGALSRHGIGRQTTTSARLYRLPDGFLIDSPGVNQFGLGTVTAPELAWAFREIRERSQDCRFADCTHLQEPGCAVRNAVESGTIAASRYASYRLILQQPMPVEPS